MPDKLLFVLIHSPLVGPFTWALTAAELRNKGYRVVVPVLDSSAKTAPAYWEQHVNGVSDAISSIHQPSPVILVGHSGAGPLLPVIRQKGKRPVAAYIFVDANLPESGKSRLDLFHDRKEVKEFRQAAKNGYLPIWSEEDLREGLPDDEIRFRFVAELKPLPLEVYEEPLPVSGDWPDAPCAYLRFGSNQAYEEPYQQALREGYETMQMPGNHFHMLVDPAGVAGSLIELAGRLVPHTGNQE
jgi:pimeloyl-ACP methyl ester carboxylesterase